MSIKEGLHDLAARRPIVQPQVLACTANGGEESRSTNLPKDNGHREKTNAFGFFFFF